MLRRPPSGRPNWKFFTTRLEALRRGSSFAHPRDQITCGSTAATTNGNGGGTTEALGDGALLGRRKVALICSQKCPGDVILKTYDFARLVRDLGIAIVSGFHSPIERDCLSILLRGPGPVRLTG
jgi:hypothetical protein